MIPIGTRIRLKSLNPSLQDDGEGPLLGRVVYQESDEYCHVALDRPVSYATVVGWANGQNIWATKPLDLIREMVDNLEVIPEVAG